MKLGNIVILITLATFILLSAGGQAMESVGTVKETIAGLTTPEVCVGDATEIGTEHWVIVKNPGGINITYPATEECGLNPACQKIYRDKPPIHTSRAYGQNCSILTGARIVAINATNQSAIVFRYDYYRRKKPGIPLWYQECIQGTIFTLSAKEYYEIKRDFESGNYIPTL